MNVIYYFFDILTNKLLINSNFTQRNITKQTTKTYLLTLIDIDTDNKRRQRVHMT